MNLPDPVLLTCGCTRLILSCHANAPQIILLSFPLINPWPWTTAEIISGLIRAVLVSEMDTVIWLSQLDQAKPEDLKLFFSFLCLLFFFFFNLLPGPLGLFMLLFRDASVLTWRVRGRSSTWAIPPLLPWCSVTTIHHSHRSPSLSSDTAVTHAHMYGNRQSCPCTRALFHRCQKAPHCAACFSDSYLSDNVKGEHEIRVIFL